MRKLKEVPNNAPQNVTNALFVGSTAELQKMLKTKRGNKMNEVDIHCQNPECRSPSCTCDPCLCTVENPCECCPGHEDYAKNVPMM